jgi:hypothetical protein
MRWIKAAFLTNSGRDNGRDVGFGSGLMDCGSGLFDFYFVPSSGVCRCVLLTELVPIQPLGNAAAHYPLPIGVGEERKFFGKQRHRLTVRTR